MHITVNGTTLFYEKQGTGEPLILLHGNGEDHHIFDPLMEKLKAHFTVYGLDSRNHGKSQITEVCAYSEMAEDLYQLILELRLPKVNLIGFSDGAIISLLFALAHEEYIHKMVLLGVNLKPSDFTEENYQYLVDEYRRSQDPLVRMMLEQPDIELEAVKDLTVETLLYAGEEDLYKPEMFQQLEAALPNARLRIMEGHDHGSYIAGTDLLFSELLAFFTS